MGSMLWRRAMFTGMILMMVKVKEMKNWKKKDVDRNLKSWLLLHFLWRDADRGLGPAVHPSHCSRHLDLHTFFIMIVFDQRHLHHHSRHNAWHHHDHRDFHLVDGDLLGKRVLVLEWLGMATEQGMETTETMIRMLIMAKLLHNCISSKIMIDTMFLWSWYSILLYGIGLWWGYLKYVVFLDQKTPVTPFRSRN